MTGPAAPSQPVTLRVSARCDAGEARTAVQQICRFLQKQDWSNDDLASFELALVEAANNAVRYADEEGRTKPILLETICEEGQVEFRIHDHTPGFEWPKTIALPPPESESGRGIYLINKIMDGAGYFRGPGENILVMRKTRPVTARTKAAGSDMVPARVEDEKVIGEMVEELSSCYECLSAIFRYTSEDVKTGNLKEFARRLCDDLRQIVSAEWYSIAADTEGRR